MIGRKSLLVGAVAFALGLAISGGAKADAMVPFVVKDGGIAKSLTGKPGDAKAGKAAAVHRKKGNCLACHKMPVPEQQFHGEVGPDLAGIGERATEAELRLRLVNAKLIVEDTMMPAYFWSSGYHRVLKKFKGKTILSAQEVEDIVAYLMTLK